MSQAVYGATHRGRRLKVKWVFRGTHKVLDTLTCSAWGPDRDASGRQLGVVKCSRTSQVGIRDSDLGVTRELLQVE